MGRFSPRGVSCSYTLHSLYTYLDWFPGFIFSSEVKIIHHLVQEVAKFFFGEKAVTLQPDLDCLVEKILVQVHGTLVFGRASPSAQVGQVGDVFVDFVHFFIGKLEKNLESAPSHLSVRECLCILRVRLTRERKRKSIFESKKPLPPRNKMKRAAVCFSGHLRQFERCKENILQNLLDPLSKDYVVDVYCSIWDLSGERPDWGEKVDFQVLQPLKPVMVSVHNSNRAEFLDRFRAPEWNLQYSTFETSGDAASMWYMVRAAHFLAEKKSSEDKFVYDLFVRARLDIVYDQPVQIPAEVFPGAVYIPQFHGKFPEVTMGMMDHFAYGDQVAMKLYSSTIDSILPRIAERKGPFTGEGFLCNHLGGNTVIRVKINYQVARREGLERVV
jgi:hypothetical protein